MWGLYLDWCPILVSRHVHVPEIDVLLVEIMVAEVVI